jgi:transcriptional regulator NrdR family protein
MTCPECGKVTSVVNSRKINKTVMRRRACKCGFRFTTNEVIVVLSNRNYIKKKEIEPNVVWTGSVSEDTPDWAKKILNNL